MELLLVLALLACPVGMGLMMWWMSRNMNHGQDDQAAKPAAPDDVEQLRDEHARLTAQIDQLERTERAGERTRR